MSTIITQGGTNDKGKNTMRILGYSNEDWSYIYKLYVHEKGKQPKDIWQLRNFWLSFFDGTPTDCVKVFIKLPACNKIDPSPVYEMIRDIIKGDIKND